MRVKVFVEFETAVTFQGLDDPASGKIGSADAKRLVGASEGGESSKVERLRELVADMGEFQLGAFDGFIDSYTLDPEVVRFITFCEGRNLEVCFLSDGMDYVVNRILRNNRVDAPVFANHVEVVPENEESVVSVMLECQHENSECNHCACCARNVMLGRSGDEDLIVYVGKGKAGFCPAKYADLVFAKETLQRYCQEHNISYLSYTTFGDVREQVERFLSRRTQRKRPRAELKRRAAFSAE
jgi:2-hydroxy-3-keto-5-methylthiopentenyl-1-phosphate phosphatase